MSDNKTIAKNTIYLYVRMLLKMAISLYTSRVVLEVMGAEDYGLYNVVGGVVTMLGFLNGSISAGTSRFITYEVEKNDPVRLNEVFNVTLVSHLVLSVGVFIIGETVGLWFVNTKLVFDADKRIAVNIVYQASIFACMMNFTQVPFSSTIIAHERMNIYAYVSILEVVLNLLVAVYLQRSNHREVLIVYSLLILLVQIIVLCTYRLYCVRCYKESKWHFVKNIELYKKILSFSGWDLIGGLSVVGQSQGVNILLNMFFGPVVNAARAVSYQVEAAFSQLSTNFMTAVTPELTKSYARKDYDRMISVVNNSALYSFYLLLIVSAPAIFFIDFLLVFWLKNVPENTGLFVRIILVNMLIRSIARPVILATHATGNIKELNLYCGTLALFLLPVVYILFRFFNAPAVTAFYTIILFGVLANIFEAIVLKLKMPLFSLKKHFLFVYARCFLVAGLCGIFLSFYIKLFSHNFFMFLAYYMTSVCILSVLVFLFGLPADLKRNILMKIREKIGCMLN